jgi:hypothetical protein
MCTSVNDEMQTIYASLCIFGTTGLPLKGGGGRDIWSPQFKITNSTINPQSGLLCFVWILEQTVIIYLHSIDWFLYVLYNVKKEALCGYQVLPSVLIITVFILKDAS